MQYYRFESPSNWNGFRDIDQEIDMDKINLEFELVENEPEEGKPGEEKSPDEVPESPSKKKKK